MSNAAATALRTALSAATASWITLDDAAVALGSRPRHFAAAIRQPGSRTKALLESAGFVVDLQADELRAA
jgi:hypothetical protein